MRRDAPISEPGGSARICNQNTDKRDYLIGTANGDLIQGQTDQDVLAGREGDDRLYAGECDDTVIAGASRGPPHRASVPAHKVGEGYDFRSIARHNCGRYTSHHIERADANARIRARRRHADTPTYQREQQASLPSRLITKRFGRIAA